MTRQSLQILMLFLLTASLETQAQDAALQQVEGFDSIVFSHDQQSSGTLSRSTVDFRGQHSGGWTAPWWAPGAMKNNTLVWKTAVCPQSVIVRPIAAKRRTNSACACCVLLLIRYFSPGCYLS